MFSNRRPGLLWNSKLLYIWLPAVIFLFPHLFLIVGGYDTWIMPDPREYGFVENATAFFFLAAGVYAFYLAMVVTEKHTPRLVLAAMLFIGAGAIFVALEEVSYGQHWMNYNTPEWFLEHNKNKELNLHNLGEDLPAYAMRTVGYIVVTLAGIIAPMIGWLIDIRLRPGVILYYFIPTCWIIAPSLFHLFANLPKTLISLFPGGAGFVESSYYFSESGEYEEYMLGVWVFLFLVMIHRAIILARK